MTQSINMTRYDEIIDKIKAFIKYYDIALSDYNYYMILANDDSMNVFFPEDSIPHILGVDVEKVKELGLVKQSTPSYDILKKLISHEISYSDLDRRCRQMDVDIGRLFSNYVDNKLDIISDILKIRTDDLYCIVKYDSERTYTTGDIKYKSDYFIVRKHEREINGVSDTKYSVLGVINKPSTVLGTKRFNAFVPVTSRLYTQAELDEFLKIVGKHQELTYISYMERQSYAGNNVKIYPRLDEKIVLCDQLKKIATSCKGIASTNKDFILTINKLINNKQKTYNNNSIITTIQESVSSNNPINKEEIKDELDEDVIPEALEKLIDACNDLMYSRNVGGKTIDNSYSSLYNENVKLKEELEATKKQLAELQGEHGALEEKHELLKVEDSRKANKLQTLISAFNTVMQEDEESEQTSGITM